MKAPGDQPAKKDARAEAVARQEAKLEAERQALAEKQAAFVACRTIIASCKRSRLDTGLPSI